MSTRLTDLERTDLMAALVRETHHPSKHAVLMEVASGTGMHASRWADALVMDLWPSAGLRVTGFEFKASRNDLKKELSDPLKWRAVGKYCDRWVLIAYDTAVIHDLPLPPDWSVWTVNAEQDGFDRHQLGKVLTPEPWTRTFIASLLRSAQREAPSAAFVARAVHRVALDLRQRTSAEWERREDTLRSRDALCDALSAEVKRLGGDPWPIITGYKYRGQAVAKVGA